MSAMGRWRTLALTVRNGWKADGSGYVIIALFVVTAQHLVGLHYQAICFLDALADLRLACLYFPHLPLPPRNGSFTGCFAVSTGH